MVGAVPGMRYLLSHEYDNVASLDALYDHRTRAYADCADSSSERGNETDGDTTLTFPVGDVHHQAIQQHPWNMRVTLCHGVSDRVIPIQMGRALAKTGVDRAKQATLVHAAYHAKTIAVPAIDFRYIEYSAGHNDIISVAAGHIFEEFTD